MDSLTPQTGIDTPSGLGNFLNQWVCKGKTHECSNEIDLYISKIDEKYGLILEPIINELVELETTIESYHTEVTGYILDTITTVDKKIKECDDKVANYLEQYYIEVYNDLIQKGVIPPTTTIFTSQEITNTENHLLTLSQEDEYNARKSSTTAQTSIPTVLPTSTKMVQSGQDKQVLSTVGSKLSESTTKQQSGYYVTREATDQTLQITPNPMGGNDNWDTTIPLFGPFATVLDAEKTRENLNQLSSANPFLYSTIIDTARVSLPSGSESPTNDLRSANNANIGTLDGYVGNPNVERRNTDKPQIKVIGKDNDKDNDNDIVIRVDVKCCDDKNNLLALESNLEVDEREDELQQFDDFVHLFGLREDYIKEMLGVVQSYKVISDRMQDNVPINDLLNRGISS